MTAKMMIDHDLCCSSLKSFFFFDFANLARLMPFGRISSVFVVILLRLFFYFPSYCF